MFKQSPLTSNSRPLVGIPIPRDYFTREPLWGNAGGYRAVNEIMVAVERAGGIPRLLFPGDEGEHYDALVIPGGGDVDPKFYGKSSNLNVVDTDPELDSFQLGLARSALSDDLPLLAICRGMQVMNVAAGGTLIQHLDDTSGHFPESARNNPDLRVNPVHGIGLRTGSKLAELLGTPQIRVNSLHHQAADFVPSTLKVVARAEDGVVEAVEGPGRYQLGVQFHPEDLRKTDSRFERLFQELVSHAG